ncbi:MAG TPA: bifunctional homocysteine S-methyltransferase/methylenetetrahydrofolate reductase [Candidatus Limnocylindrales bacterium]|jgi:homocysteine S-methyltransferase|nr:bifunctional homocysteine S-methyltransferase/methylenetetrahydrofolate reductase [Candidatus Limnocylindrales bacterium]
MSVGDARARFRDRLAGGPLLADGAMGTLLFSRGIPQRAVLDDLVATRPDLIGAIHREYLDVGADIIETATFGANRVRLAPHGLADRAGRLARRGAQLAREARDVAGRDVLVAGSIGPLGPPTREILHLPEDAVRAAFRETIEGLLEGGVDVFWFETFGHIDHLAIAVEEARSVAADLPVISLLTFGEGVDLPDGTRAGPAAAALAARIDVDIIGVNCGAGPVGCLEALVAMEGRGKAILPNAGLPQRIEGQFVYAAGPDYLGRMVGGMLDAGAAIVGGCCGTTPDHTAAMRVAIDARTGAEAAPPPAAPAVRPPTITTIRAEVAAATDTPAPPSRLARALADGRYVISVEIDPPRSVRIERTIEAAHMLQDAGVDIVNVSDSAMARVRMGALAVAFGIQHDLDLECVVHFTTRDRNLMALESELLGAHALGVRDILALTGDPPRIGDLPGATGVWDVDSIGLVEILTRLNRGEDAAGSPIGQPASFTIACALDPTAADAATEWDRLERKVAAGAHLIMTQPLYSEAQVEAMFREACRRFGPAGFPIPVLLGVLPLQSSRHAEFLHHEVPGITIPDATRDALRDAGEHGAAVGLRITEELLAVVGDRIAGTYVMPSFGRYEQAAELVRRLRAMPAARVDAPALRP